MLSLHSTLASSSTTGRYPRVLPGSKINPSWPAGCSPHTTLRGLLDGQLLCDGREEFLDILGGLGTGLEEEEVRFLCICLRVCCCHRTFIWLLGDKISLVAGQCNNDVLVRLSLQLLDPRLGFVQRGLQKCLSESRQKRKERLSRY